MKNPKTTTVYTDPQTKALGRHWLIELLDCNVQLLSKVKEVAAIMEEAVEVSGATQVASRFHQFEPYGVSGVIIIKESHFTIHTWPEHAYVALDIFTCGNLIDTPKAIDFLQKAFGAAEVEQQLIKRGIHVEG